MEVLEFNKIKENIFEALVVATKNEWVYKNKSIIINNERYIIQELSCKDFDITPRTYTTTLIHKPLKTKHNYNNINFIHIDKIERSELTLIKIHSPFLVREIYFEDPEECLNELLQLKKIQREALSNG